MLLLCRFKNKILITLMTIAVGSCSIISKSSSCEFNEINCYRFNYTSIDDFRDSVNEYFNEKSLLNPSNALSKLTLKKELSINSSIDAETLIIENPDDIYVLGVFIMKNQKPREWLFVSEQAFLRSWNNLSR